MASLDEAVCQVKLGELLGESDDVTRYGAFRALRLDTGRHLVEMVYRPSSVAAGAAVSAAGLLMGGAAGAARLLGGR